MQLRLTYPRLAAGLVVGIVLALLLSDIASAITSNVFRYSRRQTGVFSINVAALSPAFSTTTLERFIAIGEISAGSGCFNAGVNLPRGARMTRLTVWYASNVSEGMIMRLFRSRYTAPAGEFIVDSHTTDASGTRVAKTFALSGPATKVNNNAFSYGFGVCFDGSPNNRFYGARLTYTYNLAGD